MRINTLILSAALAAAAPASVDDAELSAILNSVQTATASDAILGDGIESATLQNTNTAAGTATGTATATAGTATTSDSLGD